MSRAARIKGRCYVPCVLTVTATDGSTYSIGGLTDAGIKRLGKEITELMLENAKKQRAEVRKKEKL